TARELVEALEPILAAAPETWSAVPLDGPTLRQVGVPREPVRIDTYPGRPPERRTDARIPSSIPAGINGQRDLKHTALIHNASRGGALLVTRHQCQPGQNPILTLHVSGDFNGQEVAAEVLRVEARHADPIWKFEVGVRFYVPLGE